MTKTSLMAALVLAAAVPAALAQDAAAPAKTEAAPAKPEATPKADPGRAPKLAIIDMQRVSAESLL